MTFRISRILAACLTLACATVAVASAQAATITTNYSNPQTIVINDNQPASPYPSPIAVSNLTGGDITSVTVSLNGFRHTYPNDVDVFMVAPGGQQVSLMPRAGGSADVSNVNLTFTAASTATLGTPITSGTYGANLTPLNGPALAQNGTWQLFVRDVVGIDVGAFDGGWTLSIIRNQFTTCADEGFAGGKLTLCRQVCEVPQTSTKLTGLIKLYMSTYRTAPPCAI